MRCLGVGAEVRANSMWNRDQHDYLVLNMHRVLIQEDGPDFDYYFIYMEHVGIRH